MTQTIAKKGGVCVNELERLGVIMKKCLHDAVHEGGYIDRYHLDVYPDWTDEEWILMKAVVRKMNTN